jgi:hypothetical protein
VRPGPQERLACYVYGVSTADAAPLPEGLVGVDHKFPVTRVTDRGLSAIASAVSLDDFGQEALEARLDDLAWVQAAALAHDEVLRRALPCGPLIPFRFGTVVHDEDAVRALLDRGRADFEQTLARLAGHREWGVKLLRHTDVVAERIAAHSEQVRGLDSRLAAMSEGAAYFARKRRDGVLRDELEAFTARQVDAWQGRLTACARVEATVTTKAQRAGDAPETVLNRAYLVAEAGEQQLHSVVEDIAAEAGDLGFELVLTGPWPPYNFVDRAPTAGAAR